MEYHQLSVMLGFSTIEEMELFYDVCEDYLVNSFPSKQECMKIIEEYGLNDTFVKFQNMSKDERMAFELCKLTEALSESISVRDFKANNSIIASILKKTLKLQECNLNELDQTSNFDNQK